MNITSLLITLVGIIIIIGLYLMSRIAQSKQPQVQKVHIPNLKNDDGSKFSSVLEDIPARDGSTPKPKPMQKVTITQSKKESSVEVNNQKTQPKQIILFISANDESGLDGNLVEKALNENNLKLSDQDIYHYFIKNQSIKSSLFRVANGTEPWTLTPKDLHNKKLAGLSIVMSLPKETNNKKSIKQLLSVSKSLCKIINGTLKNHKQQELTTTEEKELINL